MMIFFIKGGEHLKWVLPQGSNIIIGYEDLIIIGYEDLIIIGYEDLIVIGT